MNLPDDVQRALEGSREFSFNNSCTPEVGRLLRLFVAAAGPGAVAEFGTGCGVGWAARGYCRDCARGRLLSAWSPIRFITNGSPNCSAIP